MSSAASLHIIQSSEASARLREAERWLSARADRGALIVSASRGAADDLARTVALARGATAGLHRFSFAQLAARLAAPVLAARGIAPATLIGSEAVAARATFDARQDGGLAYFGDVAGTPGFPRALARTLHDLAMAGVEPPALRELPLGGADLARLLEGFDEQFAAASATGRAALFTAACDGVGAVARLPLLLLDVPMESAVEFNLAKQLIAAAPETLITVPFGDLATLAYLETLGASIETLVPSGDSDLSALRRSLFAARQPPEREAQGDVRLFSAPGEGRECVEIARRILDEVRGGVRFDEIAVFLRSPREYLGLLENAFERAGINAWFDRGARRPHPSGRAFLAILSCAVERLSAVRFAEYLSLAQVPEAGAVESAEVLPPADDLIAGFSGIEPPADDAADAVVPLQPERDDQSPIVEGGLRAPWKWERMIVEASVVGGDPERWRRRLRGLREGYEARIKEEGLREDPGVAAPRQPRARSPEPRAPVELRAADRRDARLLAGTRDLGRVARALRRAGAAGAAPAGARAARARRAARDGRHRPGRARGGARRPRRTAAHVRRAAAGRPLWARVRRQPASGPRARLQGRVRARPRRAALPAEAARGSAAARSEMRVPLAASAGARLVVQDDRAKTERLLLRLAVGAATERLWLSYPRLDVGGARPRVPSFYVLDVMRAIVGKIPHHEELQRDAATAGGAQARLAGAGAGPRKRSTRSSTISPRSDCSSTCRPGCGSRPGPLPSRPQPRAPALGHETMGAGTIEVAGAGRPGARDPGNQADARPAAAGRAPVLGLGAAEVLDLSVPVRPVGDLSSRAERSARAAAAARSADARLALSRSAGPRAAHAARRKAAAA